MPSSWWLCTVLAVGLGPLNPRVPLRGAGHRRGALQRTESAGRSQCSIPRLPCDACAQALSSSWARRRARRATSGGPSWRRTRMRGREVSSWRRLVSAHRARLFAAEAAL
jgi:hypothetical protein